VYEKFILARLSGKLNFFDGSIGKGSPWGTSNLFFLASMIFILKSLCV
jgi:hypothetical protein